MLTRSLLASLLIASPALATKTQFFTHGSRSDFEAGKLESLVATNFGELKLAHDIQELLADDGSYASVDALIEGPDGIVYAGTTAAGKLLAIRDNKPETLADFGEAASVSALAFNAAGDLVIGVSGEQAALHILRKGAAKPELLLNIDNAQYIWGIAIAADGKLYLGTGPEGLLVEVSADGKNSRVVFDSDEDNLRAVVALNDTLFVGTDPNGLILKIDRASGKAFVIYDAPESEISTLLLDARSGQIFAGTSQLVEAPVDNPEDATVSTGRPQESAAADHLVADTGETPRSEPGADVPADDALRHEPAMPERNEPPTDADSAPATQHTNEGSPSGPHTLPTAGTTGGPAAMGNAVYRIEPQGFVSQVFRDEVMVFGLARKGDHLYIATGPTGTLFQLDLGTEEHVAIAKTRTQQLTSLLVAQDGRLLVGSGGADGAVVSELSSKLATKGTFTSPVLDASQISAFGKLQVQGNVPSETAVTISTRSSNVSDEESPLWSDWSKPVPAARFTNVSTPAGRYVQYRMTLTGNGAATPAVDEVKLAYQQPNVAPRIESVTVVTTSADEVGEEATSNPTRQVNWITHEPNGDALQFKLFARNGPNAPWLLLAKDLTEPTYAWDTRRVSDGRYEIKVEASDALANAAGTAKTASRVSDAFIVDNTPPVLGDIKIERANGNISITVRAADRSSVIERFEYRVDDAEHWQTVQSSDMLNDSPDEQYTIVLPDTGGQVARVVSLRCRDEAGNTVYESVTIRAEK